MSDVVARAKAAMEQPLSPAEIRLMRFRSLVPELVAEVERLRLALTLERNKDRIEESVRRGEEELAAGTPLPTLDEIAALPTKGEKP